MPYAPVVDDTIAKLILEGYSGMANGVSNVGQLVANGITGMASQRDEAQFLDEKANFLKEQGVMSEEAWNSFPGKSLAAKRAVVSGTETLFDTQQKQQLYDSQLASMLGGAGSAAPPGYRPFPTGPKSVTLVPEDATDGWSSIFGGGGGGSPGTGAGGGEGVSMAGVEEEANEIMQAGLANGDLTEAQAAEMGLLPAGPGGAQPPVLMGQAARPPVATAPAAQVYQEWWSKLVPKQGGGR